MHDRIEAQLHMAGDRCHLPLALRAGFLEQRIERVLQQRNLDGLSVGKYLVVWRLRVAWGDGKIEEDRGLANGELSVLARLDHEEAPHQHVTAAISDRSSEHVQPVW